MPRRVQDAWLQIRADADLLTQRLGRSLTTRDLATELAMDERIIIEARLAARSYSPASLSAPVLDGSVLADYVAVSDDGFEAWTIAPPYATRCACCPGAAGGSCGCGSGTR